MTCYNIAYVLSLLECHTHTLSQVSAQLEHFENFDFRTPLWHAITLPYRSASCIDAPAAWLTRNFHTLRSFAAASASSTDHPKSILLMSLFMVSFHAVLGRPRLLLPWVGFQEYSLLGMREASMRCTWPNHFKRMLYHSICFIMVRMSHVYF